MALHQPLLVVLLISGLLALAAQAGKVETDEGPAAETYLSEEFFPGLHILEWLKDKSALQLYPRGQSPKASGNEPIVLTDVSEWTTMKQAQKSLVKALKIRKREPYQSPWAIFDSQGHRLENLEALKKKKIAFIVELGQWMWPAVRIGFQQEVEGVYQDGRPAARLETVSLRPVAFQVHGFFTVNETEEVMTLGRKQGLTNSKGQMMSADLAKGTSDSDFRTSTQTWLSNQMLPLIADLDGRVSKLTRVPQSHNEPAQLLRYDGGQFYHGHMDWNELELYNDQKDIWRRYHYGHQDRLGNVFWYLSDIIEGGHTIFPKFGQAICKPESIGGPGTRLCRGSEDPDMASCDIGLKVKPIRGSVLLWYNFHANGRGDRNALHAGCPPGKGETKWSANKWFSIKPLGTKTAEWLTDHPALKRFGYKEKGSAPDPNKCVLSLTNGASETVDVMWQGNGGSHKVSSIQAGKASSLDSFKGHSFVLQAGARLTSEVVCSKAAVSFALTPDFELLEGGSAEL